MKKLCKKINTELKQFLTHPSLGLAGHAILLLTDC